VKTLLLDEPLATGFATTMEPDAEPRPRHRTLVEWLDRLGNIPGDRIRMDPPPGTATEADALRINYEERSCELVDGTIVEVPVANRQELFGHRLGVILSVFVDAEDLGMVGGPRVLYRMAGGNLREPDVGFTSNSRIPRPYPEDVGPCPDLCVEVLSPSNTRAEMRRKRGEYFSSGCRLVWEIEPLDGIVEVFTAENDGRVLASDALLSGGDVLPGFELRVDELLRRCNGKIYSQPATPP
jgi:Uma2 family endonuclease